MTDTPIKISATIDVPLSAVINCIIGALEGGYSPWLHFMSPITHPGATADGPHDKDVWYSRESFWNNKGAAEITFDKEDGDEGNAEGKMNLSLVDFTRALGTMADKSPRHFADLISEDDDADTHDAFMQMVVFQDIIYG